MVELLLCGDPPCCNTAWKQCDRHADRQVLVIISGELIQLFMSESLALVLSPKILHWAWLTGPTAPCWRLAGQTVICLNLQVSSCPH
jgi:hypothetical protein